MSDGDVREADGRDQPSDQDHPALEWRSEEGGEGVRGEADAAKQQQA